MLQTRSALRAFSFRCRDCESLWLGCDRVGVLGIEEPLSAVEDSEKTPR